MQKHVLERRSSRIYSRNIYVRRFRRRRSRFLSSKIKIITFSFQLHFALHCAHPVLSFSHFFVIQILSRFVHRAIQAVRCKFVVTTANGFWPALFHGASDAPNQICRVFALVFPNFAIGLCPQLTRLLSLSNQLIRVLFYL